MMELERVRSNRNEQGQVFSYPATILKLEEAEAFCF